MDSELILCIGVIGIVTSMLMATMLNSLVLGSIMIVGWVVFLAVTSIILAFKGE